MRRAKRTAAGLCVALLTLCSAGVSRADDAGSMDPGWQGEVLQLTVNGARSEQDVIALRDANGGLWLSQADFERLRLHVPHATPHITDGTRYYPVAGIAGAKVSFDPAHSAASITLPATAFGNTDVLLNGSPRPPLSRSGTGAFLNYQLYGQTGSYTGADLLSAYTELGIFSPLGLLDGTQLQIVQHGEQSFVRLDTAFIRDFPNALETLRLGDSISVPGSWAQALRFGGLQFGTNYGIRPDLVTTPLLAATGTAVVPSTVDVFVNGKAVGSTDVPAGPFIVNQVPALNGAGDVSIVVRNAAGQEQIINVPFYSAAVMLQPGLSMWDVDVGAVRENYGIESNDYGPLMAAATWRHGFTSSLTGEVHAEALRYGPEAAGVDIAQALDHWAVVTLDLALGGQGETAGGPGSPPQPSSSGSYQALGIQHVDERFNALLQVQHAGEGFRDIGDYNSTVFTPRQRFIAQAGWNMGRAVGNVQLAFIDQTNYDESRQKSYAFTYQRNIGPGSFSANLTRTTGLGPDTSLSVFYVLPLDSRHSTTTQLRHDSNLPSPDTALVQTVQKTLPVGPGTGYLLSAGTDGSYQAQYALQTNFTTLQAQAARFQDSSAQSLTALGALTFMDGELHAVRTVSDAFATVEVGAIPDVTIFLENQPIAHTDASGIALVPYLRSWDVNRLSVDPLQLPLDASVANPQVSVVPPYRSGVLVTFPVRRERSGLFRLLLENGSTVPSGATVNFQGAEFPVGLDGLTYVTGYDHGTTGEAHWVGGDCKFRLPPPPSGDPQPDLGKITCRSTP